MADASFNVQGKFLQTLIKNLIPKGKLLKLKKLRAQNLVELAEETMDQHR